MTTQPHPGGLAGRAASALTAYRLGDSAAMSALVDEATPLLWHIARQQGLDRAAAEDVVQTAWLHLVEAAERIEDSGAVLKWLITTTKREAWRVAREARRALPTDLLPESAPDDEGAEDLADVVAGVERYEVVWRHFRQLSERCRELLAAVALSDRPDYGAVSAALGMPVGSIGPTRGRCLGKLRTMLESDPAWEVSA